METIAVHLRAKQPPFDAPPTVETRRFLNRTPLATKRSAIGALLSGGLSPDRMSPASIEQTALFVKPLSMQESSTMTEVVVLLD